MDELTAATGPAQGWLRRLVDYCLRHRTDVLIAFGAAVLGSVIAALTPLVARHVVDLVDRKSYAPIWPWAVLLLGAGGSCASRSASPAASGRSPRPRRAARHAARRVHRIPTTRRSGARRATDRPGGEPLDLRPPDRERPALLPADADRQRAAVRRLADHHGRPLAGADPRRARGRAAARLRRAAQPCRPVPRHLGRAAGGGPPRRGGRGRRHRRARGQGLRSGGPRADPPRRPRRRAVRHPHAGGCASPASRTRPAGDPRPRSGRRPRPRWIPGPARPPSASAPSSPSAPTSPSSSPPSASSPRC